MYDSVNFRLLQTDVGNVDLLAEIPCYLDNVGEHAFSGEKVVTGNLQGLKVCINRSQMKIKDGSLCKWFLGNNFKTMGRGDTQRAIEALSDTLHVPMDKATITRLDVAQNIITQHPTEVYLNHLGLLKHATRLVEPSGLYYKQAFRLLCFYDKIKEQKSKREAIPVLYDGRNVLRYEQRYTSRLASVLHRPIITGALLSDEAFYMDIVNNWLKSYQDIQKINDISPNFEAMKSVKQMYKMGLLSYIERCGGELQMVQDITEACKRGELTAKQAFDLRKAVKEACMCHDGLMVRNEAIEELDKKMQEAAKYYR